MIWNGHLDTVPYGNLSEWESDPSCTTVKGGKIYGRGASDMKSGVACAVGAMIALQKFSILTKIR